MQFIPTEIPDVILVEPKVFGDDRGFFLETYQAEKFVAGGIPHTLVQDNHSGSKRGVLRGLHYQIRQPQGKLVRAVAGEIFDVAVDMRKSSPTFGKWVGVHLSAENRKQLWVPPGFAHGFYVISPWAEVFYKTSDYYAPQEERTLLWCDPTVGVSWPLVEGAQPLVSEKDAEGKIFSEADNYD